MWSIEAVLAGQCFRETVDMQQDALLQMQLLIVQKLKEKAVSIKGIGDVCKASSPRRFLRVTQEHADPL